MHRVFIFYIHYRHGKTKQHKGRNSQKESNKDGISNK